MQLSTKKKMVTLNDSFVLDIPTKAFSWNGFREWTFSPEFPEHGKISYIGKKVWIDMSPERINAHAAVKLQLAYGLETLRRKEKGGHVYADNVRIVNPECRINHEPDLVFIHKKSLKDGKVKPIETKEGDDFWELEGSPDLVVEILSPSSEKMDRIVLRKRYFRGGIPEFWLVDCMRNKIHFQILIPGPKKYVLSKSAKGMMYSPCFAKWFRLTAGPEENGLKSYELEYRSTKPTE